MNNRIARITSPRNTTSNPLLRQIPWQRLSSRSWCRIFPRTTSTRHRGCWTSPKGPTGDSWGLAEPCFTVMGTSKWNEQALQKASQNGLVPWLLVGVFSFYFYFFVTILVSLMTIYEPSVDLLYIRCSMCFLFSAYHSCMHWTWFPCCLYLPGSGERRYKSVVILFLIPPIPPSSWECECALFCCFYCIAPLWFSTFLFFSAIRRWSFSWWRSLPRVFTFFILPKSKPTWSWYWEEGESRAYLTSPTHTRNLGK